MMLRTSLPILAALLSCLNTSQTLAAELTPDAAYAMVARSPFSRETRPKPDELAAARKVLETKAAAAPANAKWIYALGRLSSTEADLASGDAAKAKKEDAVTRFSRAAELVPGNADYQYWLAEASFGRLDDVGMLSKMSLASTGRKAYEKAIALDPNYVAAYVGLSQFFLQAPRVAGGSVDKAKAEGEALLALPDKRGEFQGRMVLANVAAHDENWTEVSRQLTAAEAASGDGADRISALRQHALVLLNRKKDAQAAQAVMARYVAIAPDDDVTAKFLDGEVKRQLGRCAEALPRFDEVLAKRPDARGSRWGAAVCREQLGQKAGARKDYEEYARRFPDDERTKEAKAALKRLAGS